jgi:signal transduction histidine kinase
MLAVSSPAEIEIASEERPRGRGRRKASSESLAYRRAKSQANRRLAFIAHLIVWALGCFLVFVVSNFFVMLIVATAWGIGLASHGFWGVLAPGLRKRWIEDEVGQRVHVHVADERRALTGGHARTLERLSASIAHEIRNPITAAKSLVQQMGEDPSSEENVEYARVALEELERVEASISHLLRYAREEEVRPTEIFIPDFVTSALETLRARMEDDSVQLVCDLDEAPRIEGDAEKLRQVLLNLIGNALDAMRDADVPDRKLVVSAGRNLAGDEAWIRVTDNGPGIPKDRRQEVFSPFYTSKVDGTGLGLAVSQKIVEAHGGTLEVGDAAGGELVITLPTGHS